MRRELNGTNLGRFSTRHSRDSYGGTGHGRELLDRGLMRDEIAYLLIVLLLAGISLFWWVTARNKRRNRRSSLRVDIMKKDRDP